MGNPEFSDLEIEAEESSSVISPERLAIKLSRALSGMRSFRANAWVHYQGGNYKSLGRDARELLIDLEEQRTSLDKLRAENASEDFIHLVGSLRILRKEGRKHPKPDGLSVEAAYHELWRHYEAVVDQFYETYSHLV